MNIHEKMIALSRKKIRFEDDERLQSRIKNIKGNYEFGQSVDKELVNVFKNIWLKIIISIHSGVFQRLGLTEAISKEDYALWWSEITKKINEDFNISSKDLEECLKIYNNGGAEFSNYLNNNVFNKSLNIEQLKKTLEMINDNEIVFEDNAKNFLK
jgi:hypothetical protein